MLGAVHSTNNSSVLCLQSSHKSTKFYAWHKICRARSSRPTDYPSCSTSVLVLYTGPAVGGHNGVYSFNSESHHFAILMEYILLYIYALHHNDVILM